MKNFFIIILFFVLCEFASAQDETFKIIWDLNTDGVTYEYPVFVALVDDTLDYVFLDSLTVSPAIQWGPFYVGTYNHDSLYIVTPDSAEIEFTISHGRNSKWLTTALFAKDSTTLYSDPALAIYDIEMIAASANRVRITSGSGKITIGTGEIR